MLLHATSSITLYAKWSLSLNIGDIGPGGGKIFYRSNTGFIMTDTNEICHYLEAAPNDMDTKLAWAPTGWTNYYTRNTMEIIGAGRANTDFILNQIADAPAAKACKDYQNNGLSDWFLPSKNELAQLYTNRSIFDNLVEDWYWTSYSLDIEIWLQNFSNGTQSWSPKTRLTNVRAIRAF